MRSWWAIFTYSTTSSRLKVENAITILICTRDSLIDNIPRSNLAIASLHHTIDPCIQSISDSFLRTRSIRIYNRIWIIFSGHRQLKPTRKTPAFCIIIKASIINKVIAIGIKQLNIIEPKISTKFSKNELKLIYIMISISLKG